jgi:hypothetical protein
MPWSESEAFETLVTHGPDARPLTVARGPIVTGQRYGPHEFAKYWVTFLGL